MKPYRADVISSMLRPDYLHRARAARAAGEMAETEFKHVEGRAVDECIANQEGCGLDVVADGEMRRNVFASQLAEAADGFGPVENNTVDWFTMEGEIDTSPVTVGVTGKIRMKRNFSAEKFVYLRARRHAGQNDTAEPGHVCLLLGARGFRRRLWLGRRLYGACHGNSRQ